MALAIIFANGVTGNSMAKRPIFAPRQNDEIYVLEKYVDFTWHSGMSLKQKQLSINELHREAQIKFDLINPLEISSKSDNPLGVSLSSFNLKFTTQKGRIFTVESAFQGSKVFERGGPFYDIFEKLPKDAKRDDRLKNSGELIGFRFFNQVWPTRPLTVFYDWLYINALAKNDALSEQVGKFDYFTDIEFNPEKSINCQARSLALFVSLQHRKILWDVIRDPEDFQKMHRNHMPKPLQTGSKSFAF